MALIEQELLTDSDAARGRARFNREIEEGINRIIPTLRMETDFEPQPADITALRERVKDGVESAIIDSVGSFFRAVFVGDKEIGTDFFLASETQVIDKRFQRTVEVQLQDSPQQVITHDYGLVGEIRWFEASPIVWHHDQTGETQIWFMNEHQLARRATELGEDGQPALIGPPFRIVGVSTTRS